MDADAQKRMKATKDLLKQWIDDNDCENILVIGLHSAGGWKYGFTTGEFEFLAACEGVAQKLKMNALNFDRGEETK